MIDPQLSGKVVLITGANHGIGAATAKAFAAQGAKVFVTFLRVYDRPIGCEIADPTVPGEAMYQRARADDAEAVVASIEAAGGQAAAWECDLSDLTNIVSLFDAVEQQLGPVEVLVNNATAWQADTLLPTSAGPVGGHWGSTTPTLTPASHDLHFAVNSRAVALLMTEFCRRHVARGASWGRIISLTTGAPLGFPGEVSYGASKSALEHYSYTAAAEFARFGINVNIVAPGATQTGWITPEMEAEIVTHTPLGGIGQPEDIADAIIFLASAQARWITGQLIHVNGGAIFHLELVPFITAPR